MTEPTVAKKSMTGIIGRALATVGVMAVIGLIAKAVRVAAPIASGELAVGQLENSNASYFTSQYFMTFFNGHTGILWLIGAIIAMLIWFGPLKRGLSQLGTIAALAAFLTLAAVSSSFAYYDVKDRPEYIEIQPNFSAFLIPLTGANKTSQKQFMSESYLVDNKIASKRIQIPHTILESGVATERNHYIPSAKLIIVDRTPYNREWAKGAKGTAAGDQSLNFESNESININTDIAVSAYIKEEDAAKYLYWFGVGSKPNAADPNSNFASVAEGKSLADVMDNVVRLKVGSLLAREFGKYSLIDGIKKKAEIMVIVEDEIKKSYAAKGITIDYVGYANGLGLEPTVQAAINKVFIANTEAAAFPSLDKMMPLKQKQADIDLKLAMGEAMTKKWDGHIPNWLTLPKEIWEAITKFFGFVPGAHKG